MMSKKFYLTPQQCAEAWDHPHSCDCELCIKAWCDMTDPGDQESMDEIPMHLRERVEAARKELEVA